MNLKKIDFKAVNVIFYIAGMFSIAFGVVFMIRSDIGTSSWDSLHWSINQLFELRFGVMWFTVGLATIVVATTFMIMVIQELHLRKSLTVLSNLDNNDKQEDNYSARSNENDEERQNMRNYWKMLWKI